MQQRRFISETSARAGLLRRLAGSGALLAVLAFASVWAAPARAHPLPISSVDLHYGERAIEGRVVVHRRDLAPELGLAAPGEQPPDPARLLARPSDIFSLLGTRLRIDGRTPRWTGIAPAQGDADALEIGFILPGDPPARLGIEAALFPRDPTHQTFVNVYEQGEMRQQWLVGRADGPVTYFAGTSAGLLAIARSFVTSGIHHIAIGPDHVLFLVGLILLGGSLRQLVLIVTAFTIGHSVTLSLAALGLFVVPAATVEPAIALSIVVVGVDNLLRGGGRDIRALLAFAFGLVHGFGFAFVLREFGLPQANLAAALVSFNLGVEIGQIAIVVVVAGLMVLVRRRGQAAARRVEVGGSLAVAAAGAYWFVERVFLGGGV